MRRWCGEGLLVDLEVRNEVYSTSKREGAWCRWSKEELKAGWRGEVELRSVDERGDGTRLKVRRKRLMLALKEKTRREEKTRSSAALYSVVRTRDLPASAEGKKNRKGKGGRGEYQSPEVKKKREKKRETTDTRRKLTRRPSSPCNTHTIQPTLHKHPPHIVRLHLPRLLIPLRLRPPYDVLPVHRVHENPIASSCSLLLIIETLTGSQHASHRPPRVFRERGTPEPPREVDHGFGGESVQGSVLKESEGPGLEQVVEYVVSFGGGPG